MTTKNEQLCLITLMVKFRRLIVGVSPRCSDWTFWPAEVGIPLLNVVGNHASAEVGIRN